MIVRISGTVSGNEVIFDKISDGEWIARIPKMNNGTYACCLYAIDDAGNTSYFATVLFTVTIDNLVCDITFLNYDSNIFTSNYTATVFSNFICEEFCVENIYLGEKRKIGIEVTSESTSDFEIMTASYECQYLENNVLKDYGVGGPCEIDGNKVSLFFEPDRKGIFVFEFTMLIAGETIIKKAQFVVE